MKLADYLEGMRAARTVEELESAICAPYKHFYTGKTWARISNVRIACGDAIVAAHPNGNK